MLPKYHIFFGILFTLSLYAFFPQTSLLYLAIVFLSSILIDGDHYVYYVFKKKNFSLIKALQWYKEGSKKMTSLSRTQRKGFYTGLYFLHGIEWIILLAILGRFFFPILTYVSIGFLFHFALDIPHEFYFKGTVHKISLIYSIYMSNKKKSKK
jgi:hypothetical protein